MSTVTRVTVQGESLVLSGEAPGALCFDQVTPGTVVVRNAYDPDKDGVVIYEAGKDYVVDYASGTITRLPGSRIPDFSTNMLYGKKDFDHNQFPGFGNTAFFVYVDYTTQNGRDLFVETNQGNALKQTRERLLKGGPFKVVAFGDSITYGGDATEERLQFTRRYVQWLQEQFSNAQITFENGATGGDSTVSGLARLEEKVLTRAPDLVLLGFGMNDHNISGPEPDVFHDNLVQLIKIIRERTGADVLMFSAFPPNPDWKYGSHRMELYAAATERAAVGRMPMRTFLPYGIKCLRGKTVPACWETISTIPVTSGTGSILKRLKVYAFNRVTVTLEVSKSGRRSVFSCRHAVREKRHSVSYFSFNRFLIVRVSTLSTSGDTLLDRRLVS